MAARSENNPTPSLVDKFILARLTANSVESGDPRQTLKPHVEDISIYGKAILDFKARKETRYIYNQC